MVGAYYMPLEHGLEADKVFRGFKALKQITKMNYLHLHRPDEALGSYRELLGYTKVYFGHFQKKAIPGRADRPPESRHAELRREVDQQYPRLCRRGRQGGWIHQWGTNLVEPPAACQPRDRSLASYAREFLRGHQNSLRGGKERSEPQKFDEERFGLEMLMG